MPDKYRLVTRSDLDGLVCAVLLKEKNLVDEVKFVHPKDMQDGLVEIGPRDITTNLPYVAGAHLVFDHHASEALRNAGEMPANFILDPDAPSAARVVYRHFGGEEAFPAISKEMMEAVDKADSAQFSEEEILSPSGWVLLNYITDPRTGLGRFRDFRISNYNLMLDLTDHCHKLDIDDILQLPDVKERTELYFSYQERAIEQLKKCAKVYGNAILLDLREEAEIYPTNRFMIYTLFPDCKLSIHVMWGLKKQNTVLTVGASIINRGSSVDIGSIMLEYGGGGHAKAGTCQVENDKVDALLEELTRRLGS